MSVVVFGAAGTGGQRIVAEAVSRGLTVVPVVRDTTRHPRVAGLATVRGDATDPQSVSALLAGADAAVIAVGESWTEAARTVLTAAAGRVYVLHMGGGATLTLPDGTAFVDLPGFPAEYLVPARGQAEALAFYRAHGGSDWTYLSPPPVDFAPGDRTGDYRTGDDQPVTDGDGNARISYEDYAVALVDEITKRAHAGRRFTVGY
ncbi:NAD(P)-dependent oxidoreductase [Actinoplanes couchii]|uniref:3-beta hydroxysteroid dehydrogenase n=1 Tax=Actinoplanes couchii TaxID=403638 RepID=A0ABQ3XE29_9ACTN|nr:putative NADH-flavin reductase [Actinoplanes couchii]GID56771.1 3-beta hydroxysteroid dehydrogenase [Actinoplanes couchii]